MAYRVSYISEIRVSSTAMRYRLSYHNACSEHRNFGFGWALRFGYSLGRCLQPTLRKQKVTGGCGSGIQNNFWGREYIILCKSACWKRSTQCKQTAQVVAAITFRGRTLRHWDVYNGSVVDEAHFRYLMPPFVHDGCVWRPTKGSKSNICTL